jgi:hypothetical protein
MPNGKASQLQPTGGPHDLLIIRLRVARVYTYIEREGAD